MGVGSDHANALSATIIWVLILHLNYFIEFFNMLLTCFQVLKDGAGHFTRIFFAWWKG